MTKHLSFYENPTTIARLADLIESARPIPTAAPNDVSAAMSVVLARRRAQEDYRTAQRAVATAEARLRTAAHVLADLKLPSKP
jgi:hypothetical protein